MAARLQILRNWPEGEPNTASGEVDQAVPNGGNLKILLAGIDITHAVNSVRVDMRLGRVISAEIGLYPDQVEIDLPVLADLIVRE